MELVEIHVLQESFQTQINASRVLLIVLMMNLVSKLMEFSIVKHVAMVWYLWMEIALQAVLQDTDTMTKQTTASNVVIIVFHALIQNVWSVKMMLTWMLIYKHVLLVALTKLSWRSLKTNSSVIIVIKHVQLVPTLTVSLVLLVLLIFISNLSYSCLVFLQVLNMKILLSNTPFKVTVLKCARQTQDH